MLPWRIAGAVALTATFVVIALQVRRLIDDLAWSDGLMWMAVAGALTSALCVIGWTWAATENARRLVEPAANRDLPDPRRAAATWLVPFAFVAVAVVLVAYLGANTTADDDTVSSIPLAVAVICLLLAIPMTYRPLHYLSGVVRQVGGHSASLARWMWVPVVLGLVGVGVIVALRLGGASDGSATAEGSDDLTDAAQWAPLWVVAVVAILPCVIVVLLAWRAGAAVEEAIQLGVDRRRRMVTGRPSDADASIRGPRVLPVSAHPTAAQADRPRVALLPGLDLVRLGIVTLLAGLALLTLIAAGVVFLFWSQSEGGALLPSQRERAWDALGVLQSGARFVGVALLGFVSIWTFLAVANVRLASARRRNPIIAAAAWPVSAVAFWMIADRLVVDASAGSIVVGLACQAAVLAVPFVLLERAADAVDARRTPLRITYLFVVVLLVYLQALGGLASTAEDGDSTDLGRLVGFLVVGALVQLLSTLAVTEACRSMEDATERDAERHNALVDQRERILRPNAGVVPVGETVLHSIGS